MSVDDSPSEAKRPNKGLKREPSRKRSCATFDQIVNVTRAALRETGRDEFTLKQIVAKANIPFGTIYQFFYGKQGLLDYVWPDRRDTHLADDYTPPKERSKARGLRHAPSGKQGHATFDRIVKAAVHILQTTGRDDMTVTAIITAADVPVGMFYRYFKGRKALLDYLWPDREDIYLTPDSDT